jgi:hypothetical protein
MPHMEELQETLREKTFKLEALGAILAHARQHLSGKERKRIDVACVSLIMHTRGEHPYRFNPRAYGIDHEPIIVR